MIFPFKIQNSKFKILRLAANESAPIIVAANADGGGAVFELCQPDSMFIPYGDFPHKVGIQHFDKAAAEAMIAANGGILARVGKWLNGDKECPVYIGHPDLPGSKDTDKKAYGWVDGMTAENEGMRLSVKWSPAGDELVRNAHFRFYSPMWWLQKTKGILTPVGLKSIGLTNDPNIPVPALANEAETEDCETEDRRQEAANSSANNEQPPTANSMNKELLAALGLPETAMAEEVLAAITALKDAAANAETAKSEAETAANECKTKAANDVEAAQAETTAAKAALQLAANHAVQAAVVAGRILPAEAEAKTTEILAANDLAEALQGLCSLPAKFKTVSTTGDLGTAKAQLVIAANDEAATRRAERAQCVANEYAGTNPANSEGARKRLAWQRAAQKNPELFRNSSGSAA